MAVRRHRTRPMGRLRPVEPRSGDRQFHERNGPHLLHGGQHAQKLPADGTDLRAVEEVLRRAQEGQQSRAVGPQGAAEHSARRRNIGPLHDRLPAYARRRELHARRTGGHRHGLREDHRRGGRRVEGVAGHREPHGHEPHGQGSDRRGGACLRHAAPPPRSGALLHAQAHRDLAAALARAAQPRPCARTLRAPTNNDTGKAAWYTCFP